MAQENTKQKEVGLLFRNLDNFGVSYKSGSEKALWRYNVLMISGSNSKEKSDDYTNETSSAGISAGFGREYRKDIVENFELRYGADLSFSYSHTKMDYEDENIRTTDIKLYQPGINLVFGLNYVVNDKLVIGVELLPSFSYRFGESTKKNDYNNNGEEIKSDISGFYYGISNTSAAISIAYRFLK